MSLVSPDVLKYNVVNPIAWGMMPCGTAATKYSTWFLEIPDRIEEPKIKMPTTTKELSLLTARFLFFFFFFFSKAELKSYLDGDKSADQPNCFITVYFATSFAQEAYQTSAIPSKIADAM